jgi:hypothetical protein
VLSDVFTGKGHCYPRAEVRRGVRRDRDVVQGAEVVRLGRWLSGRSCGVSL